MSFHVWTQGVASALPDRVGDGDADGEGVRPPVDELHPARTSSAVAAVGATRCLILLTVI